MCSWRAVHFVFSCFPLFCTSKSFCFSTGWLDDVGLTQYKSAFSTASLDGRVLNSLTWVSLGLFALSVCSNVTVHCSVFPFLQDDLHNLKINVELHCLSLKRGIQVLRKIDFNLDRLRRRPIEVGCTTVYA